MSFSDVTVLGREDWGARTDLPRQGHEIDRDHRTEVFVHHTVMIDDDSTANEWESLDEVAHQMRRLQTARPDLGNDVPYSMVAFCMGDGGLVLCEGRGLSRTGAHAPGHNHSAIAIAFQGDFEHRALPASFDSQLHALGEWLRDLRVNEGYEKLGTQRPSDRDVWGHRDVKATACPGRTIASRLSRIRFVDDPGWSAPGDPIEGPLDARAVLEAAGITDLQKIEPASWIPLATLADRLMRLDGRVTDLEGTT